MSDRILEFFTSDWHIGHANSIVFDQRPFKDLDHMHRTLINNYNSTVPKNGKCFFLGDVGLSNSETLKNVISELNGTKILILGNHDKGSNSMYNVGFDVVLNKATIYIAGQEVTMSHCPLKGVFRELTEGMRNSNSTENWHGESRHDKFLVEDRGQFHLHGHIHSSPVNGKLKIYGRQWDVGVPANNYRPVSKSAVESWIAKYMKESKK